MFDSQPKTDCFFMPYPGYLYKNTIMDKGTKRTILQILASLGGLAFFTFVAICVPDESPIKLYFAYFCVALLIGAIIWYTPFGNPIKRLIAKFSKKK